jgi:DNA-binding transcriptional MerR regulator
MALQQISFNFFDDDPLPQRPSKKIKTLPLKDVDESEEDENTTPATPAIEPVIAATNFVEEPVSIVNDFTIDFTESSLQKIETATQITTGKEHFTTEVLVKKKGKQGRKSIKENEATVDLVDVPSDEELFKKSYYTMGKVADMFKVNQSLLRYWEKEFSVLKPKKNGKGDRLFRPEDIKNLQIIHHLVREKKYTIDGAKDFLKKRNKIEETFKLVQSLKRVRSFLIELKANL